MTDKVQKIREEVERMHNLLPVMDGDNISVNYADRICTTLEMYIDSLQEEPISSIWHDASEKSNEAEDVVVINPSDNTGEVLTGCIKVYQGRIWAYTSVLLKLDNPCKIGKNLQEEYVSEDLEKAGKEWLAPQLDNSYAGYGEGKMMELTHFDGYAMLDAINFGANWQKAKDQSIIELAEDHAMLAGMKKMKEEMMEKAVIMEAHEEYGELWGDIRRCNTEKGKRYKVIIIKED